MTAENIINNRYTYVFDNRILKLKPNCLWHDFNISALKKVLSNTSNSTKGKVSVTGGVEVNP